MIATVVTSNRKGGSRIRALLSRDATARPTECPNSTMALAITARDLSKTAQATAARN